MSTNKVADSQKVKRDTISSNQRGETSFSRRNGDESSNEEPKSATSSYNGRVGSPNNDDLAEG